MAKKKKGSGTRIASRAEREARNAKNVKAPEPFGPKRYMKENWFRMALTGIILFALAAIVNIFLPGDYFGPCVVAYIIGQVYMYLKAAREEKKKKATE